MTLDRAPDHDEIEISIFGPGYGEAIVVHAGDGNWIVIDSCINPASKRPSILEYFSRIGVNPAHSVKLVIATHWHDDHVKGLAEIVRTSEAADFICSDAIKSDEFLELVSAYGERPELSRGLCELREILDTLKERRKPPIFAISNRLLSRICDNYGRAIAEVHSLSPSDESIRLSRIELAKILPEYKDQKGDIVAPEPNHLAVVIWVAIGTNAVLLGSDLQNGSSNLIGWNAIIESNARPTGTASIYKVPHHGSENGENPDIWRFLLAADPISILTPFSRGKVRLPTIEDVRRIRENSKAAYVTAVPEITRIKRERLVEEFVKGATKSIRVINGRYGQVRLRGRDLSLTDEVKVELFGSATKLA